jgi:putative CocE/NonD family hydrolase
MGVKMITDKNIMVPMRDGIRLATDIFYPGCMGEQSGRRPEQQPLVATRVAKQTTSPKEGVPLPVLAARTPYNKDGMVNRGDYGIESFVKAGYIVAVQDVRGRYASEGDFNPHFQETIDGVDFFEWLLKQEWCDGNIGTFGGSYLGETQLVTARLSPKGLKAMVPVVAMDDMYTGCIYQGGTKVMHDLVWTVGSIIPEILRRSGAEAELPSAHDALYELPIAGHPAIRKWGAYYHDQLDNPSDGDFWRRISANTGYGGMTAPALHISGWYDIFTKPTINNYMGMKKYAGSEKARKNTRLIMGGWTHGNFSGLFPEFSFGEGASDTAINLQQIKIDWYDKWVKGLDKPNGPPVKIFIMGANIWRDEQDWPLPDTKYREYYLHSKGSANSLNGDGWLSTEKPGDESPDNYTYDPMNPVQTVGGQVILPGENSSGPKDQQEVEKRNDVLVYTTPVFEKPMEVTGNIILKLYASSDSLDTDFTGKLVDVYPDGRAMILTDGILRARYRDSFEEPKHLVSGEVYEFTIDLWATANVFLPGHRLRLEVSSSNFPKFNRNSNTGGDIAKETAEQYKSAQNKVYHDAVHASRLILPIIERA